MAGYERTVKKLLTKNGWSRHRQPRGSHEIWKHASGEHTISVPYRIKKRHTANAVLKSAGIDKKL